MGTGVVRLFDVDRGTRPMPPSRASVLHTFEAVAGSWGSVSAPAVSKVEPRTPPGGLTAPPGPPAARKSKRELVIRAKRLRARKNGRNLEAKIVSLFSVYQVNYTLMSVIVCYLYPGTTVGTLLAVDIGYNLLPSLTVLGCSLTAVEV